VNPGPPPEPACGGARRRSPRPTRGPVSLRPAAWLREAACAAADPDLFFPDDSRSAARAAKEVCAGCPVQPDCLEYSLAAGEEFGVWGGLTEKERHNLLRADRANPTGQRGQRGQASSRPPGAA
jgi:WhiB family redox-sensing transcriptional regulator